MFVGEKNENINFKNMACQCDDAIPGSFARAVGNPGTSLSNRAHRENFRHHSRTQSPSYARSTERDEGLWPNPYQTGI
jgi:3-dehydroquinate dehydratase